MLSLRLVDCVECSSIPVLLSDIDCKMKELANNLYNNVVYSLNQSVPTEAIIDLLHYKRILTFKICNPDYCGHCGCISIDQIASRVKLLKHK